MIRLFRNWSSVLLPALLSVVTLGYATAASAETVKVFVLTGQSNMEGKGLAAHLDTYKEDPAIAPMYSIMKKDGAWVERDDVWITYPTKSRGAMSGPLTAGYGTKGEFSIGPEFGFGHTVGEALDEKVLIVKVAWGGKSLAVDFFPPSAKMPSDEKLKEQLTRMQKKKPDTTLDDVKQRYGFYYRQLVAEVQKSLATYEKTFPALKGTDYEIAGIVWHQGFNDIINRDLREDKYSRYTELLTMFIKDLRKDLKAGEAPFVIGELSTGGIPNRGDFQIAQAAAAKPAEFKGTVSFVPTAEYYDTAAHELYKKNYWKGTDEQKAQWVAVGNDRPYHYLGSGKTYFLKGQAFGHAMLKMLK